jgi:hypothetical protein
MSLGWRSSPLRDCRKSSGSHYRRSFRARACFRPGGLTQAQMARAIKGACSAQGLRFRRRTGGSCRAGEGGRPVAYNATLVQALRWRPGWA